MVKFIKLELVMCITLGGMSQELSEEFMKVVCNHLCLGIVDIKKSLSLGFIRYRYSDAKVLEEEFIKLSNGYKISECMEVYGQK